MKFFKIVLFIALSNSLSPNLVYPYDAQDILAPSHQLFDLCSKLQNQLPKNAFPNTFFPTQEILVEEGAKNDLLISLQEYLYSKMEGIPHACEYGLCLQHLLIFEHFHYHISESEYPDNALGDLLLKHDTCTLLPKQHGNLNYLLNENCSDIEPFSKFKTFIETKVSAMKLQGFNL